jgi:hypothetical protein
MPVGPRCSCFICFFNAERELIKCQQICYTLKHSRFAQAAELCVEPKITSANHKSHTPNFKLQRLPPFSEKMMLRNVLNPSDLLHFITVRAEIKFRDTFVSNARDSIHFGCSILNCLSNEARIAVTNPISAPRMLTWRSLNEIPDGVGSVAHLFNDHCSDQLKTTGALRPKLTIGDQIKKLQHKLCIAHRKKNVTRVIRIKSQIKSHRVSVINFVVSLAFV